ncbi:MAG: hypothetical protein QE271_00815 [Bacteriovoracaceae bacterium]|nr:hypothetical protein [Bacteriovoracaceae bacterium]
MKFLFLFISFFSFLAHSQETYIDSVACGKILKVKNYGDRIEVKLKKVEVATFGEELKKGTLKRIKETIVFYSRNPQQNLREAILLYSEILGLRVTGNYLCINTKFEKVIDGNSVVGYDLQMKNFIGGGNSNKKAYENLKQKRKSSAKN